MNLMKKLRKKKRFFLGVLAIKKSVTDRPTFLLTDKVIHRGAPLLKIYINERKENPF